MGGRLKALDYLLEYGADPHAFSANWASGSMPVPGMPLLSSAVYRGDDWMTKESRRVPGLCAGLACLFDRRPDLLPEWEGFLHHILVEMHQLPEKERQWRLLVADALRQRGREDLAATIMGLK